ncbi:hypothetical protein [Stappia sp. MMSF_3263]|uniref:hypothetical protein n=1 Tax=Stappia sp. MMSF_3263 TaxID=3046693 RepID=UPI00273F380B|nr:hypothetical protein [Stappia sp. MMSF_3263]
MVSLERQQQFGRCDIRIKGRGAGCDLRKDERRHRLADQKAHIAERPRQGMSRDMTEIRRIAIAVPGRDVAGRARHVRARGRMFRKTGGMNPLARVGNRAQQPAKARGNMALGRIEP